MSMARMRIIKSATTIPPVCEQDVNQGHDDGKGYKDINGIA
jgi:hypothetical protein